MNPETERKELFCQEPDMGVEDGAKKQFGSSGDEFEIHEEEGTAMAAFQQRRRRTENSIFWILWRDSRGVSGRPRAMRSHRLVKSSGDHEQGDVRGGF